MNKNRQTISQILANWIALADIADIPKTEIALAKLRILDTVGLIFSGKDSLQSKSIIEYAKRYGSVGNCTLIGNGRLTISPQVAAMAHGAIAHSQDLDDTFPESIVHPGSCIIPTALAVGEEINASSDVILTAITVGYEVAGRIGAIFKRQLHKRGFHSSGVVGPFSAAATAGKLLGLSGVQISNAFGLAGSMSGGLLAFMEDGSWSKSLHLGWAAHSGIVAAQLSAGGYTGPRSVLDGRNNIFKSFSEIPHPSWDEISSDLGCNWSGGNALFKVYPCAHVIHPYIDAALSIMSSVPFVECNIARIICHVPPWSVPIVLEPKEKKQRPANEGEAIGSMPFILAAALSAGKTSLITKSFGELATEETYALAGKVDYQIDASLGEDFSGSITIKFVNGEHLNRLAKTVQLSKKVIEEKFFINASNFLNKDQINNLKKSIDGMPLNRFILKIGAY